MHELYESLAERIMLYETERENALVVQQTLRSSSQLPSPETVSLRVQESYVTLFFRDRYWGSMYQEWQLRSLVDRASLWTLETNLEGTTLQGVDLRVDGEALLESVLATERPDVYTTTVRFKRPLRKDQATRFQLVTRWTNDIEAGQRLDDMATLHPARRLTYELNFDGAQPPKKVWSFHNLAFDDVPGEPSSQSILAPVAANTPLRYRVTHTRMRPRLVSGIAWQWLS